tara:strand:+ start:985 stop:1344 length:360 start_codon:yes stop_codon:yes gene_type:complete
MEVSSHEVVLAALALFISAIVVLLRERDSRKKKVMQRAIAFSKGMSANEMKALGAYEHYFSCGHPDPVRDQLLKRGFILPVSEHKFAITWRGKMAGEYLSLFEGSMSVVAANSLSDEVV